MIYGCFYCSLPKAGERDLTLGTRGTCTWSAASCEREHRSTHRSSTLAFFPNSIVLMSTVQTPRRLPDLRLQFRVLVLGRANAGKTTILQRVCDTTESPTIYRLLDRLGKYGQKEKVRGPQFVCEFDLTANQIKLEASMDVSDNRPFLRLLIDVVSARRAHHRR